MKLRKKKITSPFGGVYNWEYFDSPPDKSNPYKWAELMYKAMHN